MRAKILLLMIVGILFSCSSDDDHQTKIINMRVNHYQNTGMGEGLFLTFLVQEGNAIGTDNWTKLYNTIEGFDYKPGKIYDLSVVVEQVKNPPQDASSLKYTLKEIISTQDVDPEILFDIDLKTNGQSFVTTNSGYELLNQIEIDCNTLCDALNAALENKDFVVGTFKRLPNNDLQLVELK
ncbi:DUF4377 domain-containing protein [uncultured Gelidibacter sp.]|uniref:DUF4377 domain-containing protein n=1 Tax=uncultured Gelidibacter sp. TaxID=259318 RepID=UPI0026039CF4|nr:DUF4377 domain-containing protein [uncultured Gelidibacter sp.]